MANFIAYLLMSIVCFGIGMTGAFVQDDSRSVRVISQFMFGFLFVVSGLLAFLALLHAFVLWDIPNVL